MDKSATELEAEGYAAYHAGKKRSDNPYEFTSYEHYSWGSGWWAALNEDTQIPLD